MGQEFYIPKLGLVPICIRPVGVAPVVARDMMMQKMGVDPVNNLSDYLQVQFSNLPESEQRDIGGSRR